MMIFTDWLTFALSMAGVATGVKVLHHYQRMFCRFRLRDVRQLRIDAVLWVMIVISTYSCGADMAVRLFGLVAGDAYYQLRPVFLIFSHGIFGGCGTVAFHLFVDRFLSSKSFRNDARQACKRWT